MFGFRPAAARIISNLMLVHRSPLLTCAKYPFSSLAIASSLLSRWKRTPSFSSCRRTRAAHSASSRKRISPCCSTTDTWLPKRRNACAISTPTDPPPMTASRAGSSSSSKRLLFVRSREPGNPATCGRTGELPVQMMK
jgi:hypothetical protein